MKQIYIIPILVHNLRARRGNWGVWREGRGREKASILTSILHSNQSINHSITTDTTRIKRSINRAKKL